jgi:gliding motility-associated-like protein
MKIIRSYITLTILLFYLLIKLPLTGQNLVVNPSFENLNQSALSCSSYGTLSQFTTAINGWSWPNFGTSDIFSTSMPSNCFSNPTNPNALFGLQIPRTGNAILGFQNHIQSNMPSPGREYIQGHLSSPLIAGVAYHISFYVSLADKCNIACNNFGIKFSPSPENFSNFCILTTPDANYNGPPITDKLGWTRIEFCFTPQVSGLQDFIIGNFLVNPLTSVVNLPGTKPFAYYFIDDVSVEPVGQALSIPSYSICSGASATIALAGSGTYSWNPEPSLSSLVGNTVIATPTVTTVYTVTTAGSACSAANTVTVFVTPTPTLHITKSATLNCPGQATQVTVSGANSYTWSTGSSEAIITVAPQSTTIYSVSGSNGLCTSSETMEVIVMPTINLQVNAVTPICYGESTTLQAFGATHYSWFPFNGLEDHNLPSLTIHPTTTTVYSVTGSSIGFCTETKTVSVTVFPLPEIEAGPDVVIQLGELITINGFGDTDVNFISTSDSPLNCSNCSSVLVNPSETTCYTLKGKNSEGCVAFDTVCVEVIKNDVIYIPNTFTPDNDGMNDLFLAVASGMKRVSLTIYNRWGTQIFCSNEERSGWDGYFQGKLCQQGVFGYLVEAETISGNTIIRTGHVNLLVKEALNH